jgi:beta-glucosidase
MEPRRFPKGFLWGCATSAYQVEGGNLHSDWWQFEHSGGIVTGDSAAIACDHYRRFREDFVLLRELHNNAHRLSVEWSRVEPVSGEFDARELDHYREVLQHLRALGLVPMVTLHHFSSPTWFARRGGWAAPGAETAWLRFVGVVARALGDLVSFWCTLNEPNVYAYQGWVAGEFPPGRRGDRAGMYRVLQNMRRAHSSAYELLHGLTPGAAVGLAHERWLLKPADAASRSDRDAVSSADVLMERWPLESGRLVRVVESPGDYIGLNHYSGGLVAADPDVSGGRIRCFNPPGLHESDLGWVIEPRWLRDCLEELRGLDRPIYITENGLAAEDDARRSEFLRGMLSELHEAVSSGIDVRGYFHWSSLDNFEWSRGYSAPFGLIRVDWATQERTVKPSGLLYGRIARTNALPDEWQEPHGRPHEGVSADPMRVEREGCSHGPSRGG